ncbi:MAG: ADP-ribose pyrophosphatase YjhB (NUDIX family) [Salibacteraceae bacterium]|jgi:ADP-ribose pyrophosphatase YjhB (NUDIX family)
MYKVFVNKTPIVLTENMEISLKKKCVIIPFKDGKQLVDIVWGLEATKSKVPVYITHFDLDELWTCFVSQFKYVQAAGGMVFNDDNKFLVIHRNGKWDLPKGHLKKGERPEFGGMREVEEECGINGLSIISPLANTFHMYDRDGMVLKKTFWYIMRSSFDQELTPQLEEGIDQVVWKTKEDVKEMSKKSYPIINGLLKKGLKIVNL